MCTPPRTLHMKHAPPCSSTEIMNECSSSCPYKRTPTATTTPASHRFYMLTFLFYHWNWRRSISFRCSVLSTVQAPREHILKTGICYSHLVDIYIIPTLQNLSLNWSQMFKHLLWCTNHIWWWWVLYGVWVDSGHGSWSPTYLAHISLCIQIAIIMGISEIYLHNVTPCVS